MNVNCPKCGAVVHMDAVGSVNADRRPDLRDAILANHFQDTSCGACGTGFRLSPELNYLDVGRGQWITGLPAEQIADFLELEDQAQSVFDTSYGAKASPAAREIGSGLTPRLTFGWPALREKLQLRELGLDDVVVELLKVDLLRRLPEAPLAPGVECRLVDVVGDLLHFVWVESDTEDVRSDFRVRRALYDAIAADPKGWSGVRDQLTDGPFVDMQKLYLGEGRAHAGA
jgi:hypothetical protein